MRIFARFVKVMANHNYAGKKEAPKTVACKTAKKYVNKPAAKKSQKKKVKNCLLCVTGSVAAIKLFDIIEIFHEKNSAKQEHVCFDIKIVATKHAMSFVMSGLKARHDEQDGCDSAVLNEWMGKKKISGFGSRDTIIPPKNGCIYTDDDEWNSWKKRGDPVLHIQLKDWADVVLIAPLSANTLAKISHGLCDNLMTCILRAWEYRNAGKFVLLAPAMNTAMWEHPVTNIQLKQIENFSHAEGGVTVIPPVIKELMCGVTGMGAMSSPHDIVCAVFKIFSYFIVHRFRMLLSFCIAFLLSSFLQLCTKIASSYGLIERASDKSFSTQSYYSLF